MANRWFSEYHDGRDDPMDETPNPWWEVKTGNPGDYFVVENVGDPLDGTRLVTMLNQREELFIDVDRLSKRAEALDAANMNLREFAVEAQGALEQCRTMLSKTRSLLVDRHDTGDLDTLMAQIDDLLAR